MTDTSPIATARTSPAVPLSYLGAAFANVLFIKALAVEFPVAMFGAVIATLVLMLASTFAALTLQAVAAADATGRRARGMHAGFTRRFDRIAAWVTGSALVVSIAFYLMAPITEALRLPSPAFTAAIPLLAATSVLVAVTTGTLLGCGKEKAFAGLIVLEPALRLLLTYLFVKAGVGGFGPLIALLCSTSATVVAARQMVPGTKIEEETAPPTTVAERIQHARRPLARFGSPAALIALFGYGALVFTDILAVRLLLAEEVAGHYAGLTAAARFLLLLPFPLSLLLVGRVRQRLNKNLSPHPELLRVLMILAALLALSLLLVHGFARPILGLFLDHDKFASLAPELPRYAIAAAIFGVGQVLMFYAIATGSIAIALLPVAAIVMEVTLLAENGTSVGNCVAVVQLMAVLFVLVLGAVVFAPLGLERMGRR